MTTCLGGYKARFCLKQNKSKRAVCVEIGFLSLSSCVRVADWFTRQELGSLGSIPLLPKLFLGKVGVTASCVEDLKMSPVPLSYPKQKLTILNTN